MPDVESVNDRVVLKAKRVSKQFGGVSALSEVSVEVRADEVVGVIGTNGSGKTTFFNVLSGFVRVDSGTVTLMDKDVTKRPAHIRARLGLVRSFQEATVFRQYRTRDNILIACGVNAGPKAARSRADDLCELCDLERWVDVVAGELPYGVQRRLGVGIALACNPAVVLLDEPAAGLSGPEHEALAQLLIRARDGNRAFVVIDHNVGFLMPLADKVVVLNMGRVIYEGTPLDAAQSLEVRSVYLGSAGNA